MLFPMNAGGGSLQETTLWTNPSPSSNFEAQTITLSDDIDNYDFIKIKYRIKTSGSVYSSIILTTADLKNNIDSNDNPLLFAGGRESSSVMWARKIVYVSDTQLSFTTAYRVNASGTDAISLMVPIEVKGLKQTQGGGTIDPPALVGTTLWTNSSPTSAFSEQTITLSDSLANYDYIKFVSKFSTSSDDMGSEIVDYNTFKTLSPYPYHFYPVLGANPTTSYSTGRFIIYDSDTQITIGSNSRLNSTGVENSYNIPFKIIGLKKTSDFSYNDPKVVDTHNITSGQTYTFTLDASKEYILSAYSTSAGTRVLYVKNGTYETLVASGSMGNISNITTTSITVYGYAIGGATITWTLTQLN